MQIDGQCHCGSIAYEADIDANRVFICHCEDCQNFSGSAFRVRIIVASNKFKLTTGSPQTYTKIAQSGAERVMHFCGNCGTHIWGSASGPDSPVVSLSGGTTRQKASLAPVAQVWCQSRLPWVKDLDNIKSVETQNT
jgi:hypothetical protein